MPTTLAFLFLVAGILAGIVAFSVWRSYTNSKNSTMFFLMLMFAFLSVYALLTAIPLLLFPHNPDVLGYARIVGMLLIFAVILSSLRVQYGISGETVKTVSNVFFLSFLGVAAITGFLLIFNYQTPLITESGITWLFDERALILLSLSSLVGGISWAIVFFRDAGKVAYTKQRLKLIVLGIDGVLLGAAGFLAYVATKPSHTVAAIALLIAVTLLTLGMLFSTRNN